jgi:hypothetical protein
MEATDAEETEQVAFQDGGFTAKTPRTATSTTGLGAA